MGEVERVAEAHKATVRETGPPDNKKTQVTGITWVDMWRRGRDSNPRWGLAHTRFPGVRLKPLIHLSEALDYSHRIGVFRSEVGIA